MPTKRTLRARLWSPELDDFKRQELLEGVGASLLAGRGYLPNQNASTEAERAEAETAARADWAKHGDELVTWWVFGTASPTVRPWTWTLPAGPGTRPWAWWQFSAPSSLEPDKTEATYLRRLNLLLPGEAERLPDADK